VSDFWTSADGAAKFPKSEFVNRSKEFGAYIQLATGLWYRSSNGTPILPSFNLNGTLGIKLPWNLMGSPALPCLRASYPRATKVAVNPELPADWYQKKYMVTTRNGDQWDLRPENLVWATQSDIMNESYSRRSQELKMPPELVREAKRFFQMGQHILVGTKYEKLPVGELLAALAKTYRVSTGYMQGIIYDKDRKTVHYNPDAPIDISVPRFDTFVRNMELERERRKDMKRKAQESVSFMAKAA
jgi:hypothetical protein